MRRPCESDCKKQWQWSRVNVKGRAVDEPEMRVKVVEVGGDIAWESGRRKNFCDTIQR